MNALARHFEHDHPGIRISLESHQVTALVRDYTTHVADGSAPQLLIVRGRYIGELAGRQNILPLDDAIPASRLTGLMSSAISNTVVAGHHYGVPLTVDGLVYWYDRRVISKPPASLSDLVSAAASATATSEPTRTSTPTPPRLAYHLSLVTTLPYLYALGGHLNSIDDGVAWATTDRAPALRWLTTLQNLLTQPGIQASDDLSVADQAIQAGHASSSIDWSFQWSEYASLWGNEAVGVAALPPSTPGGKAPPSVVSADVVSVNAVTTDQQRKAAYEFLSFLSSSDSQAAIAKDGGVIPASATAHLEEPVAALRQAMSNAVAVPATLDTRSWNLLNDLVNSVLTGNASPDQALDGAVSQLRQPAH